MSVSAEAGASSSGSVRATRTLTVTGLNHALHDGYTDLIYVLLPVWQAEFALSYGLLALLRGLYAGAMAGFEIGSGLFSNSSRPEDNARVLREVTVPPPQGV